MHTRIAIFIVTTLALSTEGAFPIGRIGNGHIGDASEFYTVTVPDEFSLTERNGQVLLDSGQLYDVEQGMTSNVNALSYHDQFAKLKGASRDDIAKYFTTITKTSSQLNPPNCSLTIFGEQESSYVAISTWNDGSGYMLVGSKTTVSKNAMLDMINSTVIETPCSK